MAEGEYIKQSAVSRSSDIRYDFYCQFCSDDGIYREAEGFCVDCQEYLCDSCLSAHRRTRQSRYHHIQAKDEMPKDTPLPTEPERRDISTKCKVHPETTVEFYCNAHNTFGCNTYCFKNHQNCPRVKSIIEESKGICESQEYTEMIQILKQMKVKSRDLSNEAKASTEQTKPSHSESEVLESINEIRAQVNKYLDKLEKDVKEEAEKKALEEERIASFSQNCESIADSVEKILTDINSLQSSRHVCQIYIALKERKKEIEKLKAKLNSVEESFPSINAKSNSQLKSVLNKAQVLRKILFDNTCMPRLPTDMEAATAAPRSQSSNTAPSTPNQRLIPAMARHMVDINVRHDDDEKKSCITGSAFVTSNKLVIADWGNTCVKLVDTQSFKMVSTLKVSSQPWDITAIDSGRAAVILQGPLYGWKSKILLLNVKDTLSKDREMVVDMDCGGIAFSDSNLVVTYTSKPRLEIINLHGTRLRKIHLIRTLFNNPKYVCASNDGQTLYVSDASSDKVVSLSLDGVVKTVYTDRELKCPHKVCMDHCGYVYVCGYSSRNVQRLTADLSKVQTILSPDDGLDSDVLSVSHCKETNRLFIGMDGNDKVKVFQIS